MQLCFIYCNLFFFLLSYSGKCEQYIPLWETLGVRFVILTTFFINLKKMFVKLAVQITFLFEVIMNVEVFICQFAHVGY